MKKTEEKIKKIYDFVLDYTKSNNYPPSVREICAVMGFKSTSTAQYYLDKMISSGIIQKSDNKKRALSLSANETSYIKVPLVGTVTAGEPILAVENLEGYYPIPDEFATDSDLFMLKVKGSSMIDAGIYDGDKIIVKKQNSANNGDIVVAFFNDSATVKRFFKKDNKIILHPENPTLEDIILDDVDILGKVQGLIRKM